MNATAVAEENCMYIISELHNQYSGDLGTAEQMILQSKLGGAQATKIQLYDPQRFYGNQRRQYLSLSFEQVRRLQEYAAMLRIDFFASFFDDERLDWCLKLEFPVLKIASVLLEKDLALCRRAVENGRRTLVSLGKWDWKARGMPFEASNVEYLYTVSKYPATLEEIEMPDFTTSRFAGYSDHTIGTTASLYAIARGARVLEKHYTISPSLQKETELAHAGAMTFDDLRAIRTFWDGMNVLSRRGPAYAGYETGPGLGR
jgi:N,N'-diacetyllegionaminate synthase